MIFKISYYTLSKEINPLLQHHCFIFYDKKAIRNSRWFKIHFTDQSSEHVKLGNAPFCTHYFTI